MTSNWTSELTKDFGDTSLRVGDATYGSPYTLQVRDMALFARRQLRMESSSL